VRGHHGLAKCSQRTDHAPHSTILFDFAKSLFLVILSVKAAEPTEIQFPKTGVCDSQPWGMSRQPGEAKQVARTPRCPRWPRRKLVADCPLERMHGSALPPVWRINTDADLGLSRQSDWALQLIRTPAGIRPARMSTSIPPPGVWRDAGLQSAAIAEAHGGRSAKVSNQRGAIIRPKNVRKLSDRLIQMYISVITNEFALIVTAHD
jgi:hypothetical protein